MKVKVVPVGSALYEAKAKRPTNSRMDLSAVEQAEFTPLPAWQDALGRYLEILKDMGEL